MTEQLAAPTCSIEVYPFEGGPVTIQGGQIQALTVEKSLRGGSVGTVEVQLAPGGPNGAESSPTWTQIITPMSHILVGMTRGSRSAIVHDGIVTGTREDQDWQVTDQGPVAARYQAISGADFAWFFRSFNYYALTFFGLGPGNVYGQTLNLASAGLPALIDSGLLAGTPANVARLWYNKIMAGPGAILGKTYVPYKGNKLLFGEVVGALWEDYPNITIPMAENFMAAEESWMDKFMGLLPMPWYEFFVTTAPNSAYTLASGATGLMSSSAQFTMATHPKAEAAGPQLVARLNPAPDLGAVASVSRSTPATLTDMDVTRWNALPLTAADSAFYASDIGFDVSTARNFYMLNPTAYSLMYGNNSGNSTPFQFSFMGACDPSSVSRYGFRPEIGSFRWMWDPQGRAAQNSSVNIPQTIATLLARLISWQHPSILMARASVVFPLMPDVRVGTRFRYSPFKSGPTWDFYVEAVRHQFVFGGRSTTTLSLARGLPTAVYQDPTSGGKLKAIHIGNAQRVEGDYAVGLPPGSGPSLAPFGTPESMNALMGNLAQIFVTPQPAGF